MRKGGRKRKGGGGGKTHRNAYVHTRTKCQPTQKFICVCVCVISNREMRDLKKKYVNILTLFKGCVYTLEIQQFWPGSNFINILFFLMNEAAL